MQQERTEHIYKIVHRDRWQRAGNTGVFTGAGIDVEDGYIHLSSAEQVAETLRVHFAGQQDLLLVAIDPAGVSGELKWEGSRGGQPFPHLYGVVPMAAVVDAYELLLVDGRHQLPEGVGTIVDL